MSFRLGISRFLHPRLPHRSQNLQHTWSHQLGAQFARFIQDKDGIYRRNAKGFGPNSFLAEIYSHNLRTAGKKRKSGPDITVEFFTGCARRSLKKQNERLGSFQRSITGKSIIKILRSRFLGGGSGSRSR